MSADYALLVASGNLYVLRVDARLLGAIHLTPAQDALMVSNLVVDPVAHGQGYGRALMLFAEAQAREKGLVALTLFTNELMHENIALYTKIGFVETSRKTENHFQRVYFRKDL